MYLLVGLFKNKDGTEQLRLIQKEDHNDFVTALKELKSENTANKVIAICGQVLPMKPDMSSICIGRMEYALGEEPPEYIADDFISLNSEEKKPNGTKKSNSKND